MPLFGRRQVEISGVVGALQFVAENDRDIEDGLYGYAAELRQPLRDTIARQVSETLGPEFELVDFQVLKGSAVFLIVIGAVGTIYMGFSRYESFIKSVNLLVSQVATVIRNFFRRSPGMAPSGTTITGAFRPAAAVANAEQALGNLSGLSTFHLLLGYIVFSHAVLLGILIWLVVRSLK